MKTATFFAVAILAAIGIFATTGAYASIGPVDPAALSAISPVLAIGAGSIARLMIGPFANRICFSPPNDDGTKTVEQLALEIKAEHKNALDAVKAVAEEALGKVKSSEQLTSTLKEKADEALIKMNTLGEQVAQIEQRLAEGGGNQDDERKSIGQQLVESDGFKSFQASNFSKSTGRADLKIKATLTSATTNADGSVGDGVQNTRLPGILPLPQRRLVVRDLITPGRMDGSTLEYVKETGFNNNAGMVAEGAAKPGSDLKLDLVTTSAKVIAHWIKASKQILDDVAQLRSMIDERLLFGLAYKEEGQLLNGDGTGQNLLGIIPQATTYTPPISLADLNIIDVLRLAMLQAALAEYPATGHVMHPTDWASIETLKDSQGRYIIGNPQGQLTPTLWRLPVVETQAIAVRKFLTGAFKLGAQLFDRWDARVEVGYENDDFTKNLVTILGEERLALAVFRPEAFIYGDFDVALAA
jgi:HK97 family phage major capsid protein